MLGKLFNGNDFRVSHLKSKFNLYIDIFSLEKIFKLAIFKVILLKSAVFKFKQADNRHFLSKL